MRIGIIAVGIILAAAGLYIAMGNFSFKQSDEVAKVGPVEIDAQKSHTVPPVAGIVILVVGAGLVLVGAMKKS